MKNIRIIARLDIKSENLVKGIHLEGLRIIGDPSEYAKKYYEDGADEIYYEDTVASLYGRNNLKEVVKKTAKNVSIPLLVGGGLRSIEDIREILRAGSDKVSINSQAIKDKSFITRAVKYFGSSTIVLNVTYKSWPDRSFLNNKYKTVSHGLNKEISEWKKYFQVYVENGREQTGLDAIEWIIEAEKLGIGEVMLTSIDYDGTKKGFDLNLTKKICSILGIPVIVSGGCGSINDVEVLIKETDCDAVSIASSLHYNIFSIKQLKQNLNIRNIKVTFHE